MNGAYPEPGTELYVPGLWPFLGRTAEYRWLDPERANTESSNGRKTLKTENYKNVS